MLLRPLTEREGRQQSLTRRARLSPSSDLGLFCPSREGKGCCTDRNLGTASRLCRRGARGRRLPLPLTEGKGCCTGRRRQGQPGVSPGVARAGAVVVKVVVRAAVKGQRVCLCGFACLCFSLYLYIY